MAKESMKAREVKRAKCVERYVEKREALKASWRLRRSSKLPRNAFPN